MKRRWSWLSGLLVLLLSVASAQADKEKAKDHFRKGMAKYTLEKWDEAIAEFEEGYTEEPDPSFLYNIAQAHRLANRPKQALDFYRKFLNKRPDAPNRGEIEDQMAALQKGLAAGTDPIAPGTLKGKPGPTPPPPPTPVKPEPEPVAVKPEPAPVVKPVTPPPPPVKPEPAPVVAKVEPKPAPAPVVAKVEPKPAPVVAKVEPKPAPAVAPVPAGARDLGAAPASPAPAAKSRWPLWVGIAAGAVVVAGGAAAAGVLLSRPGTVVLPAEQVP